MRLATLSIALLVAIGMCSCSTVLPETNPDHQIISALIRSQVQNSETTVKDPIRIEIRGDRATAYYTADYRTAQQFWNPMKSTLVRKDGAWVVKESKSTKPWYYCYK
jgi:hypothetical protein